MTVFFSIKRVSCKWALFNLLVTHLFSDTNGLVAQGWFPDKLDEIQATTVIQQINLDNACQMASASVETSTCVAASPTTLEKSLHQLWAQQPPIESETEFTGEIHVLNSNFHNVSGGMTLSGINSNYNPTFKQVFDPKTYIIAAFLSIYETETRHASDELKRKHIPTCIHPFVKKWWSLNSLI
ncbi:hypothetical protein DSO57_1023198 [Entomophthora muscae]|uniref:Uncharacterized protein n=1 Tax=Entomophthora muscae TaxID=34485 RepID=A0ACC2U1F6_9FUNG|nr:hypothetical protein DSO57_1023198 [Entomophthora muscae]